MYYTVFFCFFSNSDSTSEKEELRRRVSDLEKQLEEAKKSTPAASGAAPAALSSGAAGAGGAKKKSVKFALEPETTVIGEDAAEKVFQNNNFIIWEIPKMFYKLFTGCRDGAASRDCEQGAAGDHPCGGEGDRVPQVNIFFTNFNIPKIKKNPSIQSHRLRVGADDGGGL